MVENDSHQPPRPGDGFRNVREMRGSLRARFRLVDAQLAEPLKAIPPIDGPVVQTSTLVQGVQPADEPPRPGGGFHSIQNMRSMRTLRKLRDAQCTKLADALTPINGPVVQTSTVEQGVQPADTAALVLANPSRPRIETSSVPPQPAAPEQQPKTQAPDTRTYGSLRGLRRGFELLKRKPEVVLPAPSAAKNVCTKCNTVGHWSCDCPLRCTYCNRPGHVQSACRPPCLSCNKSDIRRERHDTRHPAYLQLEAAISSARRAAQYVRQELPVVDEDTEDESSGDGSSYGQDGQDQRKPKTPEQERAALLRKTNDDLLTMMMWSRKIEEDLENLKLYN